MSARPSRTASKVPGAAATPLGRMLHFMRPLLSFSSASHQFFWATLSVCVGGTHDDTENTVCAEAAPALRRAAVARRGISFMRGLQRRVKGRASDYST